MMRDEFFGGLVPYDEYLDRLPIERGGNVAHDIKQLSQGRLRYRSF